MVGRRVHGMVRGLARDMVNAMTRLCARRSRGGGREPEMKHGVGQCHIKKANPLIGRAELPILESGSQLTRVVKLHAFRTVTSLKPHGSNLCMDCETVH